MGRVGLGAGAVLGRVFGVVVGVRAGQLVLVLVVVAVMLLVAVMLGSAVDGVVGGGPQSRVIFSGSELHCGPSIRQARLRDGGVRSRATMQAAGGSLGADSSMSWPAT